MIASWHHSCWTNEGVWFFHREQYWVNTTWNVWDFCHETLCLSASGNAFLSQTFSAVKTWLEWGILLNSVCIWCYCISNMSLPENVAENFGASFQENLFQVDKVYTTWSISWKEQDHCWIRSQTGNELCWQKTNWTKLGRDLRLHQENLWDD